MSKTPTDLNDPTNEAIEAFESYAREQPDDLFTKLRDGNDATRALLQQLMDELTTNQD